MYLLHVFALSCSTEAVLPFCFMKQLIRLTKREHLMEFLENCLELGTSQDLEALLKDLCTEQELVAFAERWSVAKLLHMGFSYRSITQKTGASSATIARIAKILSFGTGGLRNACRRRESEFLKKALDSNPQAFLGSTFI